MCTRGHVIQPPPLSLDQTWVVWVVVGSFKVQYQSVWFEVQAFVPLKEKITCMQDNLLPQFNTRKQDLHTVWADGKVILNGECVFLKQACVLLKGKYFKLVKSSSQSLIMGKGMSACTSCGFTLGQCFEWRDVLAYYSWLIIYCLFCSAGRLSWTSYFTKIFTFRIKMSW